MKNNYTSSDISVIIPAKNESEGLQNILPDLKKILPGAEIIVVNDGSDDDTVAVCSKHGARVVSHPYSMGNGAAIKSGVRNAGGKVLVFMDADGQHDPNDIPGLIEKLNTGYNMVVGARSTDSHASIFRRIANNFYNYLASLITGCNIEDLTSGFRAAERRHFIKFLYLLPNGFSYPTTSTMAFFRSALAVGYIPIRARARKGKSHIRIFRDGIRFFIIILKIGSLFSPMRLFLPISVLLFLTGLGYYAYTYIYYERFTNMSALILISSLFIFLMGIMAEFISSLHYKGVEEDDDKT